MNSKTNILRGNLTSILQVKLNFKIKHTPWGTTYHCNMNALYSFALLRVYVPECKQQLRTMK
jgi:hypothetical protein